MDAPSPAGSVCVHDSVALRPTSLTTLFRPEVLAYQASRRQWGSVVELRPVSARALSWSAVLAAAIVVTFLCFAQYARKEPVPGYLRPSLGTAKVFVPQVGVVREVRVGEGEVVRKGQPLMTIDTQQVSAGGRDLTQAALDSLSAQRVMLARQIQAEEARAVSERQRLQALSETAGQATKGTTVEPFARLAGGVAGNLGVATAAARADAPARAITAATRGTTEADLAAARTLGETAQRVGVPLTGAEAIQGATGNATKLGDLQRAVEGSLDGGAILSRAYADRPAQMRNAVDEALAALGPQSTAPSTLGPRGSQAAAAVIDETRQGINRATRADYAAAGTHVLDPADFAPIARDPAFQAALRQLRADEVLAPVYRDLPDNSVAVIDAVTKGMRDRGVALGNRANPGFSSETAGLYTGGAAEARAIARDPARGGSQAYDDALTAQAQARRQNLEPLEQGPLGQLAQAGDTAAATQAVLPARPLVGGEAELADAVTRLRARDPDLTNELIRQRLADQFDVSATRLVGGEAQGGGARFAKDIAGTEQQTRNLDAVLEAIGGPAARQPIADVLDVLRATGTRKPQGSPTDFNQQIREAVGEMPLTAQALTALRTGGASLLTQAGDGAKRMWLGRNNKTLGEILVAPDSVEQIGTILQRGTATPFADAALRQALQSRSMNSNP